MTHKPQQPRADQEQPDQIDEPTAAPVPSRIARALAEEWAKPWRPPSEQRRRRRAPPQEED
jgi:hypothetical protein